jgi:HlyD family secretion protein
VNRLKKNKTILQSEEEKENQVVIEPDMQEFIMEKYDEKAKKIKVKDPEKSKKVLRILKKCIIPIIIVAILAIALLIFLNYKAKQDRMAAMMQNAQVETADVEKRDLTVSITTTGTVKSAESRTITSALTKTELSSVSVEVGDTVSAGQVVAVFDETDIKTNIERMEEKISVSEQTDAINAQSTDREYLYTYSAQTDTYTEAQTAVEDALVKLYDACDAYGDAKKVRQAAEDNGGTEAEITQLKNAEYSAYTAEKNAQDAYDDALLSQAKTTKSVANTLQGTDEDYLKSSLTEGDSTEELKEQLEDLQTNLENCIVTAPIGGVVTSLSVKTGDTYIEGDMMTIQNCDTYTVSAQIDEYDISDLKEGMEVVIKTDATRDDELKGVISFVSPTATASTGSSTSATYEVTVDILTEDDRLKLGMTAKLSIIVDEAKGVFTVPYDAISTNAEGESVIYTPEATQQGIVVEVGMESDYYTQIISDEIYEGMKIVIPSAAGTVETTDEETGSLFSIGGGGGGAPGGGAAPNGGGGMP